MSQTGTVWGILLAAGGYSNGESFVTRNAGLRAVWECGKWHVRIVFMDHDDLHLPGAEQSQFSPSMAVPGMLHDATHILGNAANSIPGVAGHLAGIYRTGDATAALGLRKLNEAAALAFRKADALLDTEGEFKSMFHPSFVLGRRTWERLVCRFGQTALEAPSAKAWQPKARDFLAANGCKRGLAKEYLEILQKYRRSLHVLRNITGPA
jgi:hypothetical protein